MPYVSLGLTAQNDATRRDISLTYPRQELVGDSENN